jgi:hypothetical protein
LTVAKWTAADRSWLLVANRNRLNKAKDIGLEKKSFVKLGEQVGAHHAITVADVENHQIIDILAISTHTSMWRVGSTSSPRVEGPDPHRAPMWQPTALGQQGVYRPRITDRMWVGGGQSILDGGSGILFTFSCSRMNRPTECNYAIAGYGRWQPTAC